MITSNFEEYQDNNYYSEIINYLRTQIKKDNRGTIGQPNYLFEADNRVYRLDLVELNENDEIKKSYVICSSYEVSYKLNALYKKMKLYQKVTNANVFLAFWNPYTDDELKIHIESFLEVEQRINGGGNYYVADSFSDFYTIIKERFDSTHQNNRTLFFRGHSNNNFEVLPGIYRGSVINKEDQIYHEAIRRKPLEFTENMTTFDHLVKMQHYELPTRLLDTTTNPLVALYFACQEFKNEEGKEVDGEVLIYSMENKWVQYYDSDSVCILANLAKQSEYFDYSSLIEDVKKDRPSFDSYRECIRPSDYPIHKVLCVLPKLNNERIFNQNGAFFIFGMGEKKNEPAIIPKLPYIINIKAKAKKNILQELNFLGINEAFLFPETDKTMHQIRQEFCGS